MKKEFDKIASWHNDLAPRIANLLKIILGKKYKKKFFKTDA